MKKDLTSNNAIRPIHQEVFDNRKKKGKPLWIKWIFCLIPAVVGLGLYYILPSFPKFTEYVFARGIFRILAFPYEWLMSIIPFSVTEIVVILCIPAILTLIVVWVVKIIIKENKKQVVEKGFRFVAWCLSLMLLIFMLMDGVNFNRLSVGELLELPNKQYTKDDLFFVTKDLAQKASLAREKLRVDEDGCVILSENRGDILKKADNCYRNLQKEYPFLKVSTFRVKSVLLSHCWSYTGITGVYCPWLGEANVNTDVPDSTLCHTAAHEVAHTMGFAKENECNFLGWLACSVSDSPDYVYSGYLQAYVYCSNALYKADKKLWKEAYLCCSQGVIRDLRQNNEYWDSFKGEVMDTSQTVNDTFIKVNGVESGILSYDQMVELMLRYYDKFYN